jgi:nicotinamidase/pyrazinamidase
MSATGNGYDEPAAGGGAGEYGGGGTAGADAAGQGEGLGAGDSGVTAGGPAQTTGGPGTPLVPAAQAATIRTGPHDVLMVVDVQRDFCPGGVLPAAGGNEVVPVINHLVPLFTRWVYTRDWHPHNHISFSASPRFRDGSWPPHAVQGTPGAAWCEGLRVPRGAIVVSKADDPNHEEYSGFPTKRFDLVEFLRLRNVDRVFIAGLTTDYCVRMTALDARAAGFTVFVVEDAIRGVAPDTTAAALADMDAAGVIRVRSYQIEAA